VGAKLPSEGFRGFESSHMPVAAIAKLSVAEHGLKMSKWFGDLPVAEAFTASSHRTVKRAPSECV
jgi:hypothetical protein